MSRIIIYYAMSSIALAEGEDGLSLEKLKESRAALAHHSRGQVFLRDAAHFTDVELADDDNPITNVLLIGSSDDFDTIVEAYEKIGVEVVRGPLPDSFEEGEGKGDEEKSAPTDPMSILKARATELGINFASNINQSVLQAKVDKAEAAEAANAKAAAEKAAADKAEEGSKEGESNG